MRSARDYNKKISESGVTDVKEKIDIIFGETVMTWKDRLERTNNAIFNGSENSIYMLNKLLQNGNSLKRESRRAGEFETLVLTFKST